MTRECISHHICDCHQEKIERLEARCASLEGGLWRLHQAAYLNGESTPAMIEMRGVISREMQLLSDTREEG